MELERRQQERRKTEFDMRIYSSIKKGSYTVKVTDVSAGGAFIKSKHLPEVGEIISFELMDETFKPVFMGNARVCRIKGDVTDNEKGFGVAFYNVLDERLLTTITQ